MSIVEAILTIKAGSEAPLWARPVSWRGSGQAIYSHAGSLFVVPHPAGGYAWRACTRDILDDWEVVASDVVIAERT